VFGGSATKRTDVLVLAFFAAVFVHSSTGSGEEAPAAEAFVPGAGNPSTSKGLGSLGGEVFVRSSQLVQAFRVRERTVHYIAHEFNHVEDVWEREDRALSASFDVKALSSNRANQVTLAGRHPRTGEDVVERWSIDQITGTVVLGTPISTARIGTPLPGNPGTVAAFVGGHHIPPSARAVSQVLREELYRGTDFNGIRELSVDPEGRFILVITEDSRLVQFDLSTGGVTTVYTTAEIPTLDEDRYLRRAQHLSKGRMYFIESEMADVDSHSITVIIDADNDGIFTGPSDSIEHLDLLMYHLAGYGERSNFVTDFVNL